jgi:hypothetical protein
MPAVKDLFREDKEADNLLIARFAEGKVKNAVSLAITVYSGR